MIEDPEEEMKRSQSSPLSKHKHKKDQSHLPQKTTFDIEIQTMPEPKIMKEKNVQTREELQVKQKQMKEKSNQTHSNLINKD